MSDKLYKTEPGKGGFLFSDADPPAIYRVFAKQSEALEFADRSKTHSILLDMEALFLTNCMKGPTEQGTVCIN